MRQNRLMLVTVSVLTLGLASFALAQMMGGSQGHMSMGQSDTVSQSATMGTGQVMGTMPHTDSLVNQMSQYCRMMSNDFGKLQSHFEKMMKIQDMKTLKGEMQKHYDMMMTMQSHMDGQHQMCQNMMSMMRSGGMHGMMGTDSAASESGGQHSHNQ